MNWRDHRDLEQPAASFFGFIRALERELDYLVENLRLVVIETPPELQALGLDRHTVAPGSGR